MVKNVKTGELFATFNYDGKDCADMGVYNVTSGATYVMNIEPTFTDHKVEVPAYDGKYYYGTQITGQQFQFNCFCHDLLSTEYNKLRAWLNPRKIGRLILSDQPYKYYLVKPVSVSALNAFPLTTIQHPSYSVLGDYREGDVVYTGNFTVTFETVGSAYGYGLCYYRDDLIYDAKIKYGRDYYYNSGLLYKDMSPRLEWKVSANAKKQSIPMYNPGSSYAQPHYTIIHSGTFAAGSLIQLNNDNTGASTVIDVSGIAGNITIDTASQTLTNESGEHYYGRFSGTVFNINPFEQVIELPDTFVEVQDNDDVFEYDSFYIENNVVQINKRVLEVSEDLIGQYFCVHHNGGAKIIAVDTKENTLTVEGNSTIDIPAATVDLETGALIRPAGVAYNYIEVFNKFPATSQENNVCTVNDKMYIYRNGEWVETNLFSSKQDFMNIYGDYITQYRMYGATIVKLDNITITTGTNLAYKKNNQTITGTSVGAFTLSAELQPRYL